MARTHSGTMTGTGVPTNMPELTARAVFISLNFAGTATVALQVKLDGVNWVTFKTYSATTVEPIDFHGINVPFRLNCTAYTNDVTWAVAV